MKLVNKIQFTTESSSHRYQHTIWGLLGGKVRGVGIITVKETSIDEPPAGALVAVKEFA